MKGSISSSGRIEVVQVVERQLLPVQLLDERQQVPPGAELLDRVLRTRDFWLTERTEAKMAVMFEHMQSLTNAMTVRDTEAMLRFVDAQPEADGLRVGAVGYCMSGPFVMAAAASFPDRIKAIASIHGANLVTDREDSAHLMAPRIRCESYFACAEIDKWASREIVEKLEA